MTYGPTKKQATAAQESILGKFCTRCRNHRKTDGGATLKAGSGGTRWVCATCLRILKGHKGTLFQEKAK